MTYYAYVHQKQLRMIVTESDGDENAQKVEEVSLHESTSIRSTSVSKLQDLGYRMASKWYEIGDYSYAEVKKDVDRGTDRGKLP
jgi:hypothetical protein